MTNTETGANDFLQGQKVARIYAQTTYPIVSAYEFEFLKKEDVVKERIDSSTIYFIVQRPLTYFDNVCTDNGYLEFDIVDGTNVLKCELSLVANKICVEDDPVDVDVSFFSKTPGKQQPFREVAAIKVFKKDGTFVVWWSPQKFLYEVIVKNLTANIVGDPMKFLDFRVHYIGRTFSQKVWDRLTGHENMQRVLTMEGPLGSPMSQGRYEISLIMLDIVGLDDRVEFPYGGVLDRPGIEPILHNVDVNDDEALGKFLREPLVPLGDKALTVETEAFLINNFRPAYNEILYDNYPDIKGGMRSKGYTYTDLIIKRLPVILGTDHAYMEPVDPDEEAAPPTEPR